MTSFNQNTIKHKTQSFELGRSQGTFYVGTIKGVGRIYQQTYVVLTPKWKFGYDMGTMYISTTVEADFNVRSFQCSQEISTGKLATLVGVEDSG